jgi:ABC-type branched-subunit amino acid transport system ATPase component
MSEPMALFEARNLHLRFGDRVVLENVSLAFEAGRLSGIMGPNGAGKTTCFNVLTGRYRPDRGQVLLDGRDITGRSPQAIARLGVSRSFQVMSLFDEFTVFENVAIALPAMRARGHDAFGQAYADPALVAAAHDVLDKVGLADRADDEAKALPYGAAARWRLPWRWRQAPSCCSSTSRPRGSAAMAARASPSSSAGSRAPSPSSSSSTTWSFCSRSPTRSRSFTGAR